MPEPMLTRYMQPLLAGRRSECFDLVRAAVRGGEDPRRLAAEVVWPAMAQVERLFTDDRINTAIQRMAARINRTITDQLQAFYPAAARNGRRILISCAASEHEELAAQLVADLFQSEGWEVFFVGGAVPDDELVTLLGQIRPEAYVIVGADARQIPGMRGLIDRIREINACPFMNIVVTGGVFVRADGLWREIGADVVIEDMRNIVEQVNELPPRDPARRRVGLVKKRRRKRKAATAVPAGA